MLTIYQTCKNIVLASGLLITVSFSAELPDFTTLIKDNAPTVVQINTISHNEAAFDRSLPNQQLAPEELFRYFFEGPDSFPHQPNIPNNRSRKSQGSGFFVDNKGYILTNAHVVTGSDEIMVSTTDQTEYKAELIGLDERTDIALLKINKEGIPFARIGNSDEVEVGNWVLAIGSPFGFDYTATKGIVSAVSRSLPDGTYVPFIQTDAAVNPGNSGGPLFNLQGEVIGINSQIYSSTGSFNGLAFAIPINTAMTVAEQLKEKGFVSRGWLGVAIQNVDQDLAQSFGLNKPHGALISSIIEGSPAATAGLQVGDIIIAFNGKNIKKSTTLPPMVGTIAVGTSVDIEILRNGENQTLAVTIGELDEGNTPKPSQNNGKTSTTKGLDVSDLTVSLKEKLSIENGVIIRSIKPQSPASEAGFRKGDVIVNINNQAIKNAAHFSNVMKNLNKEKPVAVLVIRQGRSLFIPLQP